MTYMKHICAMGRGKSSEPMIRERRGDWDSGRFPDRDSERNAGMGSAPATNNPPSHVQGDSSPQHLTASGPIFAPELAAGRREDANAGIDHAVAIACRSSGVALPAAQPAGVSGVGDACENLLHRLEGWGKAYPERSFPEATPEQLQWLHETRPGLCDRISAGMGRHVARMIQSDITELRAAFLAARAAVNP